jgi:hypothetical protein
MKASYLNNLTSSFFLWLDHEILSRGQAFINYTGKLYGSYDPNFDGISSIYSSPFKQWVYDSSIQNVLIPSGVYNGNTFIPRGSNGLSIDYNNGRVIFNNNLFNNNNLTAGYSLKEFNIYFTDEKEDKLLFENSYSVRPKFHQITGGLGYQDIPYPCIFIKTRNIENVPFAFAGEDKTETMIRCIILAKDSFTLDSVISIMNDSARKVFPLLNPTNLPFNYLGDFKVGNSFNYTNLCANQPSSNYTYIDRVTVSKLDESTNMYINKKVMIALVDFELSDVRNPRIY